MLGVTAHSASKPEVMDALLRSFTSVMSKSDAVSAKSATSSVRPFVSVPETNRKPEPDPDPSPSPPGGRVFSRQKASPRGGLEGVAMPFFPRILSVR